MMTDQEKNPVFNSRILHQEHSSGGALRLSMTVLTATKKPYKGKKWSKLLSAVGSSENPSVSALVTVFIQ